MFLFWICWLQTKREVDFHSEWFYFCIYYRFSVKLYIFPHFVIIYTRFKLLLSSFLIQIYLLTVDQYTVTDLYILSDGTESGNYPNSLDALSDETMKKIDKMEGHLIELFWNKQIPADQAPW